MCQNGETLDSVWSFAVNGGEDEPNAIDVRYICAPAPSKIAVVIQSPLPVATFTDIYRDLGKGNIITRFPCITQLSGEKAEQTVVAYV